MSLPTLIIKNLDSLTKEIDIVQLLQCYHSLIGVTISTSLNGKRTATVEFMNSEDAKMVIQKYNGNVIGSHLVSVEFKKSKEELLAEQSRMFYIKGVESPITLDMLECVVGNIAPINSLNPLFRPDGSFSGTVGVVLQSQKDLNRVIGDLDGMDIEGVVITCSIFDSEYQEKNQRNCFVRDIPSGWSDDELLHYCKRFGEVDSAKLRGPGEDSASTTQCGYVSFVDYKVAKLVIEDTVAERFDNNPEQLRFFRFLNAEDRKRESERKKKQQKKEVERACKEKRVLLIKNISSSVNVDRLKKEINGIHPTENFTIVNDFLQKKQKRAFATFSRPEDAAAVLSFLKQKRFTRLGLFVTLASPSKKTVESAKGNGSVIDQIVRAYEEKNPYHFGVGLGMLD